jgi:hypothetical protein
MYCGLKNKSNASSVLANNYTFNLCTKVKITMMARAVQNLIQAFFTQSAKLPF